MAVDAYFLMLQMSELILFWPMRFIVGGQMQSSIALIPWVM